MHWSKFPFPSSLYGWVDGWLLLPLWAYLVFITFLFKFKLIYQAQYNSNTLVISRFIWAMAIGKKGLYYYHLLISSNIMPYAFLSLPFIFILLLGTIFSYFIAGLVKHRYLPFFLSYSYVSCNGEHIPIAGIMCTTIIALLLSALQQNYLVELFFILRVVNLLLEYAAFITLKYTEPDTPRPFQVPFGLFSFLEIRKWIIIMIIKIKIIK